MLGEVVHVGAGSAADVEGVPGRYRVGPFGRVTQFLRRWGVPDRPAEAVEGVEQQMASAAAIRKARTNAHGVAGATFIEGDVTKLSHLDVSRPIDLVIGMGTYHSLPDNAKPTYVAELAEVMEPGTPLMMWQGIRLKPGEIPEAFGRDFIIERTKAKDFIIKRKMLRHTITAHWYLAAPTLNPQPHDTKRDTHLRRLSISHSDESS